MANRPIHVVESGGDSTGLKEFADGADSGVQLPSGLTSERDSSCLLYTSPSPRDRQKSRMPSSA